MVVCAVQVAWFRYLISFQMELADKKCRPSGSPPRDSGFAALQSRICAFPNHEADCKFAQYFRRCYSIWLMLLYLFASSHLPQEVIVLAFQHSAASCCLVPHL